MSIPEKLIAAKILAVNLRPYFATPINALSHIEKKGLGTVATDIHYRLFYDPEICDKWTVLEMAVVLIHEISHPLREHHIRALLIPGVNHALYNVAADEEINDDIIAEGLKLPLFPGQKAPLSPATYGHPVGELAETYYHLLIQDQKAQQTIGTMQAGAEGGADPTRGICGSCAHGKKEAWDIDGGGSNDTPGVSAAEAELIGRQTARDIVEHSERNGGKAGQVAAGWQRWAKEKLKTKTNYAAMIRAAVKGGVADAIGKSDYSYQRPSRRQNLYGNIVMPGLRSPTPRVGFGIDTSGSMSDKQLSAAMAEIKAGLGILGRSNGLYVAATDYATHSVKKIFNLNQIDLLGGGGTDMGRAIESLSEIRPRLGLIILLTDCETPWPADKPPIPIVVIKIAGTGEPPPWHCRVIELDLDEYEPA